MMVWRYSLAHSALLIYNTCGMPAGCQVDLGNRRPDGISAIRVFLREQCTVCGQCMGNS